MKKNLTLLLKAAKDWNEDDAFMHSAAVSFYTLFSLAPLTLVAVSIAGLFLGKDQAAEQLNGQITQLVGAAGADAIKQAVSNSATESTSLWSTVISVVMTLIGATTVFGQLQSSLNAVWRVKAKPSKSGWIIMIIHRLISFAMVVTIGFLLLVSLIVTTAIGTMSKRFSGDWAPKLAQAAELGVVLLVVTALFALVFKYLPDVKLKLRDVWSGAIAAAVLFSLGRYGIALYLNHSTVASVYGAAGSLVALLVWVYYSCAIMFFGVEFTRAQLALRKQPVKPKDTAVMVKQEIINSPT